MMATERAEKICDILGVKPNEEFKIIDKAGFKLQGVFHITESGELIDGNEKILINLLLHEYTIEKICLKAKKLRDVTEAEFDYWLGKNCHYGKVSCSVCPFRHVICKSANNTDKWVLHKNLYSDEFLDQEIEVEVN